MEVRRSLGLIGTLVAGAMAISSMATASGSAGAATGGEDKALVAGAQGTAKHTTRPQVRVNGVKAAAANPYLGLVPDPSKIDWSYWKTHLAKQAEKRYAALTPPTPFVHDEQEPAGTLGSNDTAASAEEIPGFGTGKNKQKAVRILGNLFLPSIAATAVATVEDQGSIPLATDTGIPAARAGATITSEIGDGPHGSAGDDTGDYDFFKVTATAGQSVAITTAGSALDSVVAIWDSEGELLGFHDDVNFPADPTSRLRVRVPADGDYYAMVGGYTPFGVPDDPFDSGSGPGAGEEDDYAARITVGPADIDHYAVQLKSGDVVGGVIQGGSPDITVTRPDGVQAVGSEQDASFIYPAATVLPGGGNATFAYVAEEPGWYTVSTAAGEGAYDILLEAHRPGSVSAKKNTVQKVFLDFDGERVNTGVWGGPGVRTLSPFASFVAKWGLTNADRDALIDRIVATVKENIRTDLKQQGLNDKIDVKVLNSRDNPDQFGKPNVSRVIVGGTIEQSGISTIGIASSIDPGNYEGEDQALVLLDVLSGPDDDDASLNFYIDGSSDRVKFVGTAVGNVVAHEIGHFIGSFHVDQFNDTLNLMDQGGNFALLYGVGDDGIGGTADDPDIDFGEDVYNPNEGFTGIEDTLNNSAWGFITGQGG